MSVSLYQYDPVLCDGEPCPGDCDFCPRPEWISDEDREYPERIKKAKEEHADYGA